MREKRFKVLSSNAFLIQILHKDVMKKLITIILGAFAFSSVFAANATPQELIDKLEQAVKIMGTGDFADGFGTVMAEGHTNKSPKERATDLDNMRNQMTEFKSDMGTSKRIDRVSLVFLGNSYFRVRFIDRRANGAILWTFICEKDENEWITNHFAMAGNSNLSELMKELDAADFSKEEPQTP